VIERFISWIQSLARKKNILVLMALLLLQILIASLCYLVYRQDPRQYVLGEEIEKRHIEITKSYTDEELNYIKTFEVTADHDLGLLKFLTNNLKSFKRSSDGRFLTNDSLYLLLEYPFTPPKAERYMLLYMYSKSNLHHIKTLSLQAKEIQEALETEIERVERRISRIKNDLQKVQAQSKDYRWSFPQFLSYFYTGQLQAMSFFLTIMNGLKHLNLVVMALFFSAIFTKYVKN
jgi:hypothetical protein